MSVCVEDEEDRAESAASSCVSVKSDWSKEEPLTFNNAPGPSDTKQTEVQKISVCVETEEDAAESAVSSCLSMKSDHSKDSNPYFSNEPGPLNSKDTCGHWFCRQCITPYWDQSGSSGDSSCPQCGKRSRTRPGLQRVSQTNTEQR
ncbi:protein SAN1-like [Anabas testudineus]|uniref:protein SAN1-like n=1 Tax=Anabas testudineus TaxID=64144 RepID=UPI00143DBAF9|nr:protein SAN1-like [Anabas testudineus]